MDGEQEALNIRRMMEGVWIASGAWHRSRANEGKDSMAAFRDIFQDELDNLTTRLPQHWSAWREGVAAVLQGEGFSANPYVLGAKPAHNKPDPRSRAWSDGYWWAAKHYQPREPADSESLLEGFSRDELERLHALAENQADHWEQRWKDEESDFSEKMMDEYAALAARLHAMAYSLQPPVGWEEGESDR